MNVGKRWKLCLLEAVGFREDLKREFQESKTEWERRSQESKTEWERRSQESKTAWEQRIQETERIMQENHAKTEHTVYRVSLKVDQVSKQVGNLGGRWGDFVEGLIAPSCI